MANTRVYEGPFTFTRGLNGAIAAQGLVDGEDEVVIRIRDPDEEEPDIKITIQCDVEITLGPFEKALVQACRTKSSGSEVSVWVS
jgi:hypothetical protein